MTFTETQIEAILAENRRRNEAMKRDYDPITGVGCFGERRAFDATRWGEGTVYLPVAMLEDATFRPSRLTRAQYRKLRFRYDFEYWCKRCVKIKDKRTHKLVTFVLNRPQTLLLEALESMRAAGEPVRLILLKARQWGGSTLIQMYMAWWQMVLYERCHSVISCHFKDASATIRAMYETMLANYPPEYVDEVGG